VSRVVALYRSALTGTRSRLTDLSQDQLKPDGRGQSVGADVAISDVVAACASARSIFDERCSHELADAASFPYLQLSLSVRTGAQREAHGGDGEMGRWVEMMRTPSTRLRHSWGRNSCSRRYG